MQNLRHYCRLRIESLACKQCKFGCIPSLAWTYHWSESSKFPYDSLSNLKSFQNERISYQRTTTTHKEGFPTTRRKCLNSVNLWNWKGLKTTQIVRLYATLHTIQSMLVYKNASNCSKMSKKTMRRFYDTIKWVLWVS